MGSRPQKPKRRWFQYSLRSMFVLMTVLALWLGAETHRARRQQQAIAAIQAASGAGGYVERCAWGRKWLAPYIGEDYFRRAVWVDFAAPDPRWDVRDVLQDPLEGREHLVFAGSQRNSEFHEDVLRYLDSLDIESVQLRRVPITPEGLRHLRTLKRLKTLRLYDLEITDEALHRLRDVEGLKSLSLCALEITDDALAFLRDLRALEEIDLDSTVVTDKAMEHLAGLSNLRVVRLRFSMVSDEGVMRLAALPRLERLSIDYTAVTSAGLRRFQKAAPRVEIINWHDYSNGRVCYGVPISDTCWIVCQANDKDLGYLEWENEFVRKDPERWGKEIARVFVMGEGVTDRGLEHLKGLTRLRRLVLINTQVTDEGIKKFQQALPNCQIEMQETPRL